MHAWPALSTKRSRSGHCGSCGLTRRKRVNSVYASGASAIAVPGWPALAFCTASIASARMVSIESLRISASPEGTARPAEALAWLETAIASDPSGRGLYSHRTMAEQFCDVGKDITLCYETFGDAADPTALLVMGLGTQMIAWHDDFCRELASRGLHVVRFDNRDCGRSTHI